MRLLRSIWPVFLFVLVLTPIQAQDSPFKLSVDVPNMSLEAVVKDANGRPAIHLSQSDFEIYEDGRRQEIRYFGSSETSRSILLAFDVTGVMESQAPFMVQGLNVFLGNLRAHDRVAIGTIGPDFEMLLNFRKLAEGKPIDIKMPRARMGSNLYESLDMAARRFNKEEGRKAIVAMTDGRETRGFTEAQRLGEPQPLQQDDHFKAYLKSAAKRGIPYYFIALNTEPRYIPQYDYEFAYFKSGEYLKSPLYGNGRRSPTIAEDYLASVRLRMELLAEATGGRVVYAQSLKDVVVLFDQLSRELGYSYSLGYTPTAPLSDGKFHRVEVRARGGFAVTQSRDGYGGPEPGRKN